jgi:ABC-type antimicrobial peptide transport system permease subunit
MVLTLAFAAAGLLIACLGIYAVVASAVERRRSELAIRIALGGSPRRVALLVAGQGLRPVFIGLVLGTIAAVGFGSVLRAMLFGVSPTEPSVLAGVATLVLAVGVLACLGPALRAVRAPLLTALRDS